LVHVLHVGLAHHFNLTVVPIKTLLDHLVLGAEQFKLGLELYYFTLEVVFDFLNVALL
jgi:uncharacterized membrane protein YczE